MLLRGWSGNRGRCGRLAEFDRYRQSERAVKRLPAFAAVVGGNMEQKHILCISGGKDSMATAILALEHGEPLDMAAYCEVMFDKETSGEVPGGRCGSIMQKIRAL